MEGKSYISYPLNIWKIFPATTKKQMRDYSQEFPHTWGTEKILTCSGLSERQYEQMRKRFIPLCKKSIGRYHLNILRIITLIYHMYIEYELYNLTYNKTTGLIYENQFISATISKWEYHDTFTGIFRERRIWPYKNCETKWLLIL